jgi:hypothetical protein
LFEKATQSLVNDDQTYNEAFEETLDLSGLGHIPLLSTLLFVKKVTVTSNVLEKTLKSQLPFLEECKNIQ